MKSIPVYEIFREPGFNGKFRVRSIRCPEKDGKEYDLKGIYSIVGERCEDHSLLRTSASKLFTISRSSIGDKKQLNALEMIIEGKNWTEVSHYLNSE